MHRRRHHEAWIDPFTCGHAAASRAGSLMIARVALLAGFVLACAGGCSSGGSSPGSSPGSSSSPSGSSGGAETDASQAADGQTVVPSDPGDASTFHGIELTLNGATVSLDPSSFTASTISDFNGTVWISKIGANIVGGEAFSWNTDKLPLEIELQDETTRQSPMPLGDFGCGRAAFGESGYGLTIVTIYTIAADGLRSLVEVRGNDEGSCSTHFEQWANGYRGSSKGDLRSSNGATVVPFTLAWNIQKGGN